MNAYQSFVEAELAQLEAYDNQRPAGHPYAFHLHVRRVANDMRALALAMGKGEEEAEILHMLALAHDSGKRLLPVAIWDVEGKPTEAVRAQRRTHTELGVTLVDAAFGADNRDPVLERMRWLMAQHHDIVHAQMREDVRMLCICDAYDGYSTWRPHFGSRDISPRGVLRRMSVEKAGQFDPEIMALFTRIKLEKTA